jgi:hypothetical protein
MKYLKNGQRVKVVGKTEDGLFLVRQRLEYSESGRSMAAYGNLEIVKKVFDESPVKKIEEDAQRIYDRYNVLNTMLAVKRKELAEFEKKNKNRFEKYKKHDALKRLDDFLDGKITHYVQVDSYSAWIKKIQDNGFTTEKFPLLTLTGSNTGNFEWVLNKNPNEPYPVASVENVDNITVIPCISYEHAIEKLTMKIRQMEKKGNLSFFMMQQVVKDYGIEIDPECRKKIIDLRKNQLKSESVRLKFRLDKITEELSEP